MSATRNGMSESIIGCVELADPRTLPDDGLGQGPTAPSIDLDAVRTAEAAGHRSTHPQRSPVTSSEKQR